MRPSTRAAMSIRTLSASPWMISGAGSARYQAERPIIARTISVTTVAATPPRLDRSGGVARDGGGGSAGALCPAGRFAWVVATAAVGDFVLWVFSSSVIARLFLRVEAGSKRSDCADMG